MGSTLLATSYSFIFIVFSFFSSHCASTCIYIITRNMSSSQLFCNFLAISNEIQVRSWSIYLFRPETAIDCRSRTNAMAAARRLQALSILMCVMIGVDSCSITVGGTRSPSSDLFRRRPILLLSHASSTLLFILIVACM